MQRLSIREDNKSNYTFLKKEPTWEPLKVIFENNEGVLQNFMFMGAIRLYNGNVVHLYKNSLTRRYINIDNDGNTFAYDGVNYDPTPQKVAKDYVLG